MSISHLKDLMVIILISNIQFLHFPSYLAVSFFTTGLFQNPDKIDVSRKALLTDGFSFLFLHLEIRCWRNWTVCPVVSHILGFAEPSLCVSFKLISRCRGLIWPGFFFFLFDEVVCAFIRRHLMSACLSWYAGFWGDLLAWCLRIFKFVSPRV